jgi:iron-sulfur cluster assembly protein
VLTLTQAAAQEIRRLANELGVGSQAGVRISIRELPPDDVALEIQLAAAPCQNDTVIDHEGARVYLDADVARWLAGEVLDVRIEEGCAHFSIPRRSHAHW